MRFDAKYYERWYGGTQPAVTTAEQKWRFWRIMGTAIDLAGKLPDFALEVGSGVSNNKERGGQRWWTMEHPDSEAPADFRFALGEGLMLPRRVLHKADLVVCVDVLGYVHSLNLAFIELRRMMRAGGLLFVQTALESDRLNRQRTDMTQKLYTDIQIGTAATYAGFKGIGLGWWIAGNYSVGAQIDYVF